MLAPDFYGRKPLVWWVGVVEGRKDPLYMGQLRVRIFGLHPKEKTILPTENLPWAIVMQPTTGTKTASVPREGDWVQGYFQDGEAGQSPVITGVYSGVDTIQANVAGKPYVPPPNNWGFYDPRTKAEVDAGPKPPDHIEDRKVGEPAIYRRLSYGVLEGTGVKSTNSKLSHACDITLFVKASACNSNVYFGKTAQFIRDLINGLLAALGVDPTGATSLFTSELKRILAMLRQIQEFIKDALKVLQCINEVTNAVNQITQLIASLPSRIASFIQGCLGEIMKQLYTAITNVLSSVIPGEIKELGQAATQIYEEARKTYNLAQTAIRETTNTINNVNTAITNIENLPDALATNTEAAISGLTASVSASIRNNNNAAITAISNDVFKIPQNAIDAQRVPTGSPS